MTAFLIFKVWTCFSGRRIIIDKQYTKICMSKVFENVRLRRPEISVQQSSDAYKIKLLKHSSHTYS